MNKTLIATLFVVVSLVVAATNALADETVSNPKANTPEHTVAAALKAVPGWKWSVG
jgi:hypothetical protein